MRPRMQDPRALKAMPVSTFLDDVKAAAAESVEVARAVPKAAIVGANGKATMVPAPVQMRRSSGRAGADVEVCPGASCGRPHPHMCPDATCIWTHGGNIR